MSQKSKRTIRRYVVYCRSGSTFLIASEGKAPQATDEHRGDAKQPQKIERYEVWKSAIQLLLPPASSRILARSRRMRGCYYLPLSKG
jgi:hypothetical protein